MTSPKNSNGPAGAAPQEHEETRDQVAEQMDGNADAAQVALAAADELAETMAELDTHRERVRDLEDQLLRRAAEFQNYRRRTQEDLATASSRGRAEVAERMTEVLDDLRRTREAAEQAASGEGGGGGPLYQSLKQGVDLVYKKLEDALSSFGVRPIEAVGQPFDENLHEALMQSESDEHAPGTVVGEIQKGYMLGDRVLRHAQVVVAR
jgi:molecular chaperone GrpE